MRCTCCRYRMVYINTLMIQQVLAERRWAKRLTKEDLRALTPLIYAPRKSLRDFPARHACTLAHRISIKAAA